MKANKGYFERNFILGVANGAIMYLAIALLEPNNILPVFALQLTGSSILAGLISSMALIGWFLPQMFISNLVENKPLKLPYYRWIALLRITWRILMVVVIFVIGAKNPHLLFWLFFIFYSLTALSAGMAAVPFLDIVGKSIDPLHRGSFFGIRRFIGSILGFLAGFLISNILNAENCYNFPYNYGLLALISLIVSIPGLASFCLVREPLKEVNRQKISLKEHFRNGLRLLKQDKNYGRFFMVRLFWALGIMAIPFYPAYALKVMNFETSMIGIFVSIWMFSSIVSNLFWGYLSDRKGTKNLMVVSGVVGMFAPLIAIVIHYIPYRYHYITPWIFLLAFVFNGFAVDGRKIGNTAYLLDISPDLKRPTYIGLMNTITAPLFLSTVLGGIIVDFISFQFLFIVAFICTFLSVKLSLELKDPYATIVRS